MKRCHSLDDEKKRGRVTSSDTSISTKTRGTATHMKKVRKDGTHLKHHLRRGAESAVEYMKSEWTDELDLTKDIKPLISFADDSSKFIEEIFSIFSTQELKSFTPDILKDLSVSQLKELCLEELKSLSIEKIKFICDGNKPEDFDKLKIEETNTKNNDNKRSIAGSADKTDDIQLSVDDNEYSDFLGAENIESKTFTKDAEVQANESSLESSSDEELMSDDNKDGEGEGWMNIFAKTQMEILELEMRARAIRSLMKAQEDEEIRPDTQSQQMCATNQPNEDSKDNEEVSDIEALKNVSNVDSEENETNLEKESFDNNRHNNSDNEHCSETNDDKDVNESDCQSFIGSDVENDGNSDPSNDVLNGDEDQNETNRKPDEESNRDELIINCEDSLNDELTQT